MKITVEAPSGFREVSHNEFFQTVGKLNVHPRPERERSVWELQNGTREVIGFSYPGYMCFHNQATQYFVKGTE